jgi:hypothetical protein
MGGVYWKLKACVLLAFVIGASLPASAADLSMSRAPSHHSHYRHARELVLERTYRRFRDDRYVGVRDIDACPIHEPTQYRPRVIGEPACQAARPYGLSEELYYPATAAINPLRSK